jgi:hypothetical protein
MYRENKDRVEFFVVYIEEAHASDLWQMPSNIKDQVVLAAPKTLDERGEVASSCVRKLGLEIPALVDGMDNAVERAYTGWPDRLYLIDRAGRVVYKSKPGPFGFKPDELARALAGIAGNTPAP